MDEYLNDISVQLEYIYDALNDVDDEFSELNKNLGRIGDNLERIANQMQ